MKDIWQMQGHLLIPEKCFFGKTRMESMLRAASMIQRKIWLQSSLLTCFFKNVIMRALKFNPE